MPLKWIFRQIGKLFGVPDQQEDAGGATLKIASNVAPLPVVYGTRMVEGIRVFAETGGEGNRYLYMVFALCEGEVHSIDTVHLNDEDIHTLLATRYKFGLGDAGAGETAAAAAAEFDWAVVRTYRGRDNQDADAMLTAANIGWTADHDLRGVAYLACRFYHDPEVWRGAPKVKALVKGRKVRAVRNLAAAPAYSENPADILYDYLTNARFGKGLAAADLDLSAFQTAARAADVNHPWVPRTAVGRPDEVQTGVAAGGEQALTWNGDPPANLFFQPGALAHSASRGAAGKSGKVRRVSRAHETIRAAPDGGGHHEAAAKTVVYLDLDDGKAPFAATDTVYLSFAARLQCNAILDTDQKLLENVKTLLTGCRGMLPFRGGKYALAIDGARDAGDGANDLGDFAMRLGPDEIIDGVSVTGLQRKRVYNRVQAKFVNPNADWREDVAVWPPAGSAEERRLRPLDGGETLQREVSLPTATSKYQAMDLARIILYQSRNAIEAQFRAMPAAIKLTPGDAIFVTDDTLGWTNKEMLVTGIGLDYGGEVDVICREHDSAIFTAQAVDLDRLHQDTSHRSPLIVGAPTALRIVSLEVHDGASPIFGATASWTLPADAGIVRLEVQWRLHSAAEPWQAQTAPGDAVKTHLRPLVKGQTYAFRVRAVNAIGAASPWTAEATHTVTADDTPPPAPSAIAVTPGIDYAWTRWTNPDDPGFKCAAGKLEELDAAGAVAAAGAAEAEGLGTEHMIGGLKPDTPYRLTMWSIDQAGNAGNAEDAEGNPKAVSAPVNFRTLAGPWLAGEGEPNAMTEGDGNRYLRVQHKRDASSAVTDTRVVSIWRRRATGWEKVADHPDNGTWHVAATAPAAATGQTGDFAFDTSTAGIWIKGPDGWFFGAFVSASGASETWHAGSAAPASALGANGDKYYRTATGEIYAKTAGAWGKGIDWTGPVSFPTNAPGAPGDPTLTARSRTTLTFRSRAPTSGGAATAYDWLWFWGTGHSSPLTAANSPAITLTGLAANTNYHVRVRARNGNGASAWSNDISAFTATQDASAHPAPTGLAAAPARTSGTLTWTAPSGLMQGANGLPVALSHYLGRGRSRDIAGAGQHSDWTAWTNLGSGTTYTEGGLTAATSFENEIKAVYSDGVESAAIALIWQTTAAAAARYNPPRNLAAVAERMAGANGRGYITASWLIPQTGSQDADGNRLILAGYQGNARLSPSGAWGNWLDIPSAARSHTEANLALSTTYELKLKAIYTDGATPTPNKYESAEVTITATTPPPVRTD